MLQVLYDVLREMAQSQASKKQHIEEKDEEIIRKVSERLITKETLRAKLAEHVEKVDYEMALEYATQSGVSEEPREDIFIQSLQPAHEFIDFHSPIFVFRLVC